MTAIAALPVREADAPVPSPSPVTYRLATAQDGPAIGRLFAAAEYESPLPVDWQRANVKNGWLVADRDGELVGAIQLCVGQPYGFLGDCVVRPDARARGEDGTGRFGKPGRVTVTLYAVALKMLGAAGTQVVLGVTWKPGMKRILKRYGGVSIGNVELFAKETR